MLTSRLPGHDNAILTPHDNLNAFQLYEPYSTTQLSAVWCIYTHHSHHTAYTEPQEELCQSELTPSVLGHIFSMSFGYDCTILLTIRRVYEGQKVDGKKLYNFKYYTSFWSCMKSTNNKQNKPERPSIKGIKIDEDLWLVYSYRDQDGEDFWCSL